MNDTSRAARGPGPAPWLDPTARPYLRIDGLSKRFGDFVAVDQLSLDIHRGELFCLLGGSGCGKTTLLRMLAGFEQPDAGRMFLDGLELTDLPPHARPVNMMFQSYALFPHMSVADNVAFGLKQERRPRAEIRERVEAMLALVKLSAFAARKPQQLSGGQRQRVALARALVKQPKLLLLDEPLAALDRKLREATQFELMHLQDTLGVTFVIVTHDQQEAMTLASRIGVMDHGRLVQTGTPREVYEQPATRFVADFIGAVNLFEGEVVARQGDGLRVRAVNGACELLIAGDGVQARGAPVWVALRPEKIAIGRDTPHDAGHNCARGVVAGIAYLGDATVYQVKLESGLVLKVTRPNALRHAADALERDAEVWLSWHVTSGVVLGR